MALARIGQGSVKETSEAAHMNRGECYRVVSQLVEKRLISRVPASPTKYEVTSFDTGIKNLLEEKKNEVSSLEDNIEKLLKEVKAKANPTITKDTEKSIRFVPMSPAAVKTS